MRGNWGQQLGQGGGEYSGFAVVDVGGLHLRAGVSWVLVFFLWVGCGFAES